MSRSGHNFSVHSPDCQAHLNIQSNRPVQISQLAPGSSTEQLIQPPVNAPMLDYGQQVLNNNQYLTAHNRSSSPYSVSLTHAGQMSPSNQHLQIIPATASGCQQQQSDSDYTLIILDCSPTPNNAENNNSINTTEQRIHSAACRSPCTSSAQCCNDAECTRHDQCHQHHHHQTTAELILRKQQVNCHHHHHHHHDQHHHQQQQQQQQNNQQNRQLQFYDSGSIADRSASQTTTRSEPRAESTSITNFYDPYRQQQLFQETTTTTTKTTTNNQQQRQQQQQFYNDDSRHSRNDEFNSSNSNNYNYQNLASLVEPSAPQPEIYLQNQHDRLSPRNQDYQPSLRISPNSWQQTIIQQQQQTVNRQQQNNYNDTDSENKPTIPMRTTSSNIQQVSASPTRSNRDGGTRLVKRWNWNLAEFVEEEVPDRPRPKPQPMQASQMEQQRRRDAWNEELRQNIIISPIAPTMIDGSGSQPEWLNYSVPDEQSVQSDPLYRDLMAELQRLEDGVSGAGAGGNMSGRAQANDPMMMMAGGGGHPSTSTNISIITTPDQTFQKPVFGQQITPNEIELNEHQAVEFICRLVPTSDPTMRVEWTLNGRPLLESSRLTCEHEFGVVRLVIRRCEAEDSGIYQCRAINSLGEAISRAKLLVHAKGNVQYETLNPAGLEKIHQLENPKQINQVEEPNVKQAPKFLSHIMDYVEKSEGESVHFECCLAPVDDPEMKTEWFFNGRPLVTGSRFHTIDDFGFIVLDIDWLFPRDTGEYVCRATNKFGSDFTRTVLKVRPDKNIVLDSQLASENADLVIDKLRQLEFPDVQSDEPRPDDPSAPAHFVMPLQTTNNRRDYIEGDNCHFEARVGPATDGELTVEWFHNDRPLISGHRFKPTFDFGHILLDILYVYPEDSGIYKCLARNQQGESISTFEINVQGKPSLVYQSQLPKEMVGGVKKIEQMEALWNMPPAEEEEEAPAERMPPQIVLEPKPCTAFEGSCARFCCRVLANPRPRVTWFINNQAIVPGARYKLTHDGMFHLTIPKCQMTDAGTVRVLARNLLGECRSQQVELVVKKKVDDYRGVLKNSPNPWYDEPTLRMYRRQRQNDDMNDEATTGGDQDEDFAEFLQNFKKQQLKIQMQHQHVPQVGAISPLASDMAVVGYMEPETPDVNLLLASKSPLVEPGDLHPVVAEQQAVMAPAPSTVQRALQSKDSVEVKQPQLVQMESKSFSSTSNANTNTNNNNNNNNNDNNANNDKEKVQQQRIVFGLQNHPPHQQSGRATSTTTTTVRRSTPSPIPSANQDVEHGREVHSQTHKQLQVEHRPNQEILREIIEREIFEQEHSGFSKDNLVVQEKQNQKEQETEQQILIEEHMEPPEFTQKIQPCQAFEGDEAIFECAFKGDPEPTITWYCENRLIKPSNLYVIETDSITKTSRLLIKRVTMAGSAIYTVKAENVAGSAKSSANLVVEAHPLPSSSRGGHARQVDSSAPTINTTQQQQQQQQQQQHLGQRDSITSIEQLGGLSGGFSYQQQHQYSDVRGQQLTPSDDPLGSGRDTPDSSISSQGKIIKSVRTRRLSPDQMANRLRASPEGYVPPTFLQTMYDLSAKVSDVVRLDVRLIGSQPMEIRWLKNGERVRADKGHKLLLEGDLYTLLILECANQDEGYYECMAQNQVGEARCGAQLRVVSSQSAAAAAATPVLASASPASSGLFGITTTTGAATGGALSSSMATTTTTTTTTTRTSTTSGEQPQPGVKMHFGLTAKPKHQHQMTYTPVQNDGVDRSNPAAAPLPMIQIGENQLALVPKLIKGLESQQVREGKPVTLRCQISAHPQAEISWFKHGDKLIKPSKYFRTFKDNDETHCLKILEVFAEDQGEYKCVARAQNGSLETSATIEVLPNSPGVAK